MRMLRCSRGPSSGDQPGRTQQVQHKSLEILAAARQHTTNLDRGVREDLPIEPSLCLLELLAEGRDSSAGTFALLRDFCMRLLHLVKVLLRDLRHLGV
jgi:hypothetical protein